MTHPTIEEAHRAYLECLGGLSQENAPQAFARVILSAPPSEAEVEAGCMAGYGRVWKKLTKGVQDATMKSVRAALTAARAKRLEELEGK